MLSLIKKLSPYGMVGKGDLNALIKALDMNHDGLITPDDFEKAMQTP